jgi:hypothetical protein
LRSRFRLMAARKLLWQEAGMAGADFVQLDTK